MKTYKRSTMRQYELLEQRYMRSSSFASISSHGTLSVIGTKKNDAIEVSLNADLVVVRVGSGRMNFPKGKVQRVWVDGFQGNDKIHVSLDKNTTVSGSGGNDTLVTSGG